MPPIELYLSSLPTYEDGAILLTILGWPESITDEKKLDRYHKGICRRFITHKCAQNPEWAVTGRVKPTYLEMTAAAAQDVEKKLIAKLKERELAARAAIPFIRAGLELDPALPPDVARLSVNALLGSVMCFYRDGA